jgi:selenocysteine-specific elongation factor
VLARVAVIGESAEIKPGESGFAQLRLESSVAAILGERFILRSYSPQVTIAGGSILRPAEEKIKRRESAKNVAFLSSLAGSIGNHAEIVKVLVDHSGNIGITPLEIRAITGWRHEVLYAAIQVLGQQDAVVQCESALISKTNLDVLNSKVLATVEQFHKTDPLSKGPPLDILRDTAFKFIRPDVERAVLKLLANTQRISIENDVVRLSGHTTRLSTPEENVLEHLRRAYTNAGLEVPKLDEALAEASKTAGVNVVGTRKLFQRLVDGGEVVQVTPEFYFSRAAIEDLIEKLREDANKSADRMIDVPQFKEIAGVSRKFAIPLLEYFDQRKITARRGDKRFII